MAVESNAETGSGAVTGKGVMSPHVIGTKDGREQALFFQFGGSSSSGLPPGGDWRCMTIDGLSDVSVREGEWHTGKAATDEPQSCVDLVDAHVAR